MGIKTVYYTVMSWFLATLLAALISSIRIFITFRMPTYTAHLYITPISRSITWRINVIFAGRNLGRRKLFSTLSEYLKTWLVLWDNILSLNIPYFNRVLSKILLMGLNISLNQICLFLYQPMHYPEMTLLLKYPTEHIRLHHPSHIHHEN